MKMSKEEFVERMTRDIRKKAAKRKKLKFEADAYRYRTIGNARNKLMNKIYYR